MELDYNPSARLFFLTVERTAEGVAFVQTAIREHGLDFSVPASTASKAVLFTPEPYAAVTFYDHATPRARQQLEGIHDAIEASRSSIGEQNFSVPAGKELWGFQKANLDYASRRRNTLIGDQPGLGKTPVAIVFANEIKAKNILAIVPAQIRSQWVKMIYEWSTLRFTADKPVHAVMYSRQGVHPDAHWTVVSYEMARTPSIHAALLRKAPYDLLILDEAHYLKTIDAQRTRAIFGGGHNPAFVPISLQADRILALSGTPLPNRPREAYTLARSLCFDAIDWMSEAKFCSRFNPSYKGEVFNPQTGRSKIYIDERSGRHSELQNRLRSYFMTRHLKREVMTQLKYPVYDLIQMEETNAVKQALQAESLLDIDPEHLEGADATVLGHIAVVRRQMGVALAPQVGAYVDMLLDGGEEKLVVFGWHIEVLNILEHALAKWSVVRVDGSTSGIQKDKRVKQFISDPRCQVILGNILSLGTGTDGLQQVSCHALIAEPDWVPGNNIQCFDRLDRGGQTRQVQGDICVAPGSFAEKILASALRKLRVVDKALDARTA